MEATGFASVLPWQGLLSASCSGASQATGGSGLGPEPVGYRGRERKRTERADQKREGEGAGHRGNLHIPSSPGHQTNSVASYPNQNLGCPGARSRRQLRPCLLQAGQPGREVEKLTPSLSCQGPMLPGHWSSQCPYTQTGRAHVCADSTGLAGCGVILGPWGASQPFPGASRCCHRCQGGNIHPSQKNTGPPGTLRKGVTHQGFSGE